MPDITLIILIAALVLAGGVLLLARFSRDASSIVLVFGIAVTAAIVTGIQVTNYRQQQAAASQDADLSQSQAQAINNMPPPPTGTMTMPAIPPAPALMKGPTGGAAPAAVRNPYSRS